MRVAIVVSTILTVHASGATLAAEVSRDPCRVTASAVDDWRTRPGATIVDIRSETEFREVRIPGSLNIPAFALRTKSHLRTRPVLLIGRGAVDAAGLMERCRSLRDQGFADVGVFEAGLAAWGRAVGDLVGDGRAVRQLALMSPVAMMQWMAGRKVHANTSPRRRGPSAVGFGPQAGDTERADSHGTGDVAWPGSSQAQQRQADRRSASPPDARLLVIDVSPAAAPVEPSLRAHLIRVPPDGAASLRARVERGLRKHDRVAPVSAVVLADADGSRTEELLAIIDQLPLPEAYVLEGGVAAYGRFVAEHGRVSAAAGRDCTTCGGR